MESKSKVRVIKASEIVLPAELKAEIARVLAPVEAWEAISNVEAHIEEKVGTWVSGLEMILDWAISEQNAELARVLIKDLIGLSKLGKAKAEITMLGGSKLRPEADMSALPSEILERVTGRSKYDT